MAGVSFELQEILGKKGLFSFLRVTGYAMALSSGNWLLATGAILILGALAQRFAISSALFLQYKTYVTYVIALSLIVSGAFQLFFTRYIADRLFELALWRVFPNYCGALLLVGGVGYAAGLGLSSVLCRGLPLVFHLLFASTLGVLSGIWLTSSLLVGLKNYGRVTLAFSLGYAFIAFGTPFGFRLGLLGGLSVFYVGQLLLLCLLAASVWRAYQPSGVIVEWDFLRRGRSYPVLIFIG
ncbi:MAG: exopolysaccharide Pel transporter PelG, partial [Candidatus Caldatribacterium sp.]|nr:exopolysaccharide Pel transporter PelG [Candidatus Caldatribacterium sp.]